MNKKKFSILPVNDIVRSKAIYYSRETFNEKITFE